MRFQVYKGLSGKIRFVKEIQSALTPDLRPLISGNFSGAT
jgi:hypothetical protein